MNKRGRKPAEWMYKLSTLDLLENSQKSLKEAAELLGTTAKAVQRFCQRQEVKGEYQVIQEKGQFLRVINLHELKKITLNYIQSYNTK